VEPTQNVKRQYFMWHRAREAFEVKLGELAVPCRKSLSIVVSRSVPLPTGLLLDTRKVLVRVDRKTGQLIWDKAAIELVGLTYDEVIKEVEEAIR
jgi:hypothetical protein